MAEQIWNPNWLFAQLFALALVSWALHATFWKLWAPNGKETKVHLPPSHWVEKLKLNFLKLAQLWNTDDLLITVEPGERHTLVIDLDETMIHTFIRKPWLQTRLGLLHGREKQVVLNNNFVKIFVAFRPRLATFLQRVSRMFNLAVYTAGERAYAEPIINVIEEECGVRLPKRYYRQSCRMFHGIPLKDLSIIGVDLAKVAIIDNSESGYFLQRNNGIRIETWTGSVFDNEFDRLLPLLQELCRCDDIRYHHLNTATLLR